MEIEVWELVVGVISTVAAALVAYWKARGTSKASLHDQTSEHVQILLQEQNDRIKELKTERDLYRDRLAAAAAAYFEATGDGRFFPIYVEVNDDE